MKTRILVAEDEPMSLRMTVRTLQRAGYEVIAVENGRKAVDELCKPEGPLIALIDWMMPELDGPGVCREVRERCSHYIHLVVLTSKTSKWDVSEALKAGANDYLTKPFVAEELKQRLLIGVHTVELQHNLLQTRVQEHFIATHDGLTSLLNREGILDILPEELIRTRRDNTSTSLLMIDIDQFKPLNDAHGPAAWDEVLKEVSERLLKVARPGDVAARYGSQEFLLLLGNCNAVSALGVAEGIRKSIADLPVETTSGPLSITASIGIFASNEGSSLVADTALEEAMSALHTAKSEGRNCCRLANQIHTAAP